MFLRVAAVCIIAWFATRISVQTADDFIFHSPDDSTSSSSQHRPGSGAFFDKLAPTYDFLNEIISLGYQSTWRNAAISKLLPADSVLDVSTGTADLAIKLASNRSMRVVGLDPSPEMLRLAQRKLDLFGSQIGAVELVNGVAEHLPFDNASFNGVVVAFGVRNFENRQLGLSEMARVLAPPGKLVVLETVGPDRDDSGWFTALSRVYVKHIMPLVGGTVSGQLRAYRYLAESMDEFPCKEEFVDMLSKAGLLVDECQRLGPVRKGPLLCVGVKQGAADGESERATVHGDSSDGE